MIRILTSNEAGRLLSYRTAWIQESGLVANYEASVIKVFGTESYLASFRLLFEIVGPPGYLKAGTPGAVLASRLEALYRGLLILTFGGGVNEMQRDLITMFSLGFPRAAR